MRRVLFVPVMALVATLLLAGLPLMAQAQTDDLQVAGQHVIQVRKGTQDAVASVTETLLFANTGNDNFTGTLRVDLDPDAAFSLYYYVDGRGDPLAVGGTANRQAPPSETIGGHVRYTFDLAADGVSFPPGTTRGIHVEYTLPADDLSFTRGFTRDTPALVLVVTSAPGLRPESEATPFEPLGTSWVFTLEADADGPFQAGDAVAFAWVETQVPLSPLGVAVRGTVVDDTLRLRAEPTGGIAPYTVTWDLDGDGQCDDAEGTTTTMDVSEAGTHTAKACVVDSAAPIGEATQSYETRTTQAAPTTTSPTAWMLGAVGLIIGALLVYGLVAGGMIGGAGRTRSSGTSRPSGPSFGAESRDMLQLRQRVMVASLKELELAKKKGEVPEGLYTPLKSELKQDTVRVMRELEKRKTETV